MASVCFGHLATCLLCRTLSLAPACSGLYLGPDDQEHLSHPLARAPNMSKGNITQKWISVGKVEEPEPPFLAEAGAVKKEAGPAPALACIYRKEIN